MNGFSAETFAKAHQLYSRLHSTWLILFTASLASFAIDFGRYVPIANPFLPTLALLVAYPYIRRWKKNSRRALELEDRKEQNSIAEQIQIQHQRFGLPITVIAGFMIPGGLILIQFPVSGWVILAALYSGAYFHISARKLWSESIRKDLEETQVLEPTKDSIEESNPYKSARPRKGMSGGKKAAIGLGIGALIPIAIVASIVTPPLDFTMKADRSKAVVARVSEQLPDGYSLLAITGSSYGIDYINVDSDLEMSRKSTTPDLASGCKQVISWAKKLGAIYYLHDPTYTGIDLDENEAAAQIACVYNLGSVEPDPENLQPGGSTAFILQGRLTADVDKSPFNVQINISREEADPSSYLWHVSFGTMLNASEGELFNFQPVDANWQKYYKTLEVFGRYRFDNPEVTSLSIEEFEALAAQVGDIKLNPMVSADGKVDLMEMKSPNKSMLLDLCVNIGPWRSEFTGVDNPGTGYVIGPVQSPSLLNQFGRAITGACPLN